MLNLVQLQERLKDVPMQALMQYANGANPQVPPFLALGELNRRKKMQEGAAAEQAQEMEGAPTVKQQIEQATGLMALQGNRQRQAARQQAGVQAAMPMAAPNTTTSEPAQLAGGGFIDDIVVPRDYQAGGPVSPAMLQALAKARAMRRPRGLSGLPMRPDMFRRGDYASGGIVAFQGGGDVKRVSGKTLSEYMASVADTLNAMPQLTEQEKIDRMNLARQQFMQSPADAGSGSSNAGLEGEMAFGLHREARGTDKNSRGTGPVMASQISPSGDQASVLESLFGRPRATRAGTASGISALTRALGLDPSRYFETKEPRSVEDIMAERKRLQGLAGISEEYLDARDRRLAELQGKREQIRAGQPMEQLAELFTSISTGPRGGTFGTQAAVGAKASSRLRAQQEALRDKQDMEMEELKFATAAKRDAIRRGDLGEAERLRTKEEELKRDMLKNQADLIRGQAQLETQGRQVEAYGQSIADQAARMPSEERIQQLYRAHIAQTKEAPSVEGYLKFRDRYQYGGRPSMVMTYEDAYRMTDKSLSPVERDREAREILSRNASYGGSGGSAGSATLPAGVKVTREK